MWEGMEVDSGQVQLVHSALVNTLHTAAVNKLHGYHHMFHICCIYWNVPCCRRRLSISEPAYGSGRKDVSNHLTRSVVGNAERLLRHSPLCLRPPCPLPVASRGSARPRISLYKSHRSRSLAATQLSTYIMVRQNPPTSTSSSQATKKVSRKALRAEIAALKNERQELEGALLCALLTSLVNSLSNSEIARRAGEELEEARRDGTASEASDLIPRPRGSPGDASRGFVLKDAMGLSDNNDLYKRLRVSLPCFTCPLR
jgi:hypothetical protein